MKSGLNSFFSRAGNGLFRLLAAMTLFLLLLAASHLALAADAAATNHAAVHSDAASVSATNLSAVAASLNSVDVLDDKYHLVIGDQLSFRIVEDEEDPVVLTVTDSGEIQVPYLGRYPAAGKTCKELALELKAALEKKYYYQATVIVAVNAMPRSRGRIYLVGAVRAPGPQDISSDEILTVSKAILRAGGFTDFANEKKVKITRAGDTGDGKKTILVDVSRILEKGEIENDVPLQPGDLIFVPERLVRF